MIRFYKNGKAICLIIISVLTFLLYLVYFCTSGFGSIGYSPLFLFVPIVVYTAMFLGGFRGFFFGLAIGFLLDCTAVANPYFNILVLMSIGLCAGVFSKIYINTNIVSGVFISFIFNFLYSLLHFLVSYFNAFKAEGFWFLFLNKVVLSTFYTTLFGVIAYIIIKSIWHKFCYEN